MELFRASFLFNYVVKTILKLFEMLHQLGYYVTPHIIGCSFLFTYLYYTDVFVILQRNNCQWKYLTYKVTGRL